MHLLIIGGSDAGISAALRARELDPTARVTVVVADRYPNFSICGLPFFLSGETPRWEDLAHRTTAQIEAEGIELKLDTTAEAIEPSAHRVRVRSADGRQAELTYDRLVVGTGAAPVRPSIPGIELPGVFQLHTIGDSFLVHEHLAKHKPRRALVVGGGYIGLEMADALRHRAIEVTLVEALPTVLQTMDADIGRTIQSSMASRGVEVLCSTSIESFEKRSEWIVARARSGKTFEADLVLVVVGVRPDVALGQGAGIELGERGALRVNRRMETNVPDVFAAGDCVETFHRLLKRPTYMPLGTTAHKQGRVAGANAVGHASQFAGSLGTQVVKVFDQVVGRTGLREDEATANGLNPVTVEAKVHDHKAYYPGATDMVVRVTADRGSGRLLGAQLVGKYGAEVSKRLDVFAAAIFKDASVADMADMDLSYTPPLSSPWDPVQMACMAWARQQRI